METRRTTMSRFIEIGNGVYVRASEVVSTELSGFTETKIRTKSGAHYIMSENACGLAAELECNSGPVIKADPGYSVACVYPPSEDNEQWETRLFPVVGWTTREYYDDFEHEAMFQSMPIVAGMNKLRNLWALVWPDGKVVESTGQEYESVKEWLKRNKRYVLNN
jgi:hypothetical protein